MSTILFVTIDAGGNVPPALAVARELQARGHRIVFLAHPQQQSAIENDGFQFAPFTMTHAWNHARPTSALKTISDYARAASSRRMVQDFLATAAEQHAELAVVDCMLPGIVRAARTHAVPCAVLFHSFYAFWSGPWARGPVGRLAQLRGVNPRKAWAGADLELVVSDPALDPASGTADQRRVWTGPAETGAVQRSRTEGRQRILVSLSTLWLPGQVDVYRRILSALAELPVDAIVTTGGQATPNDLNAPPNVEVVGYVDHAEILPTVDLVICHGGHSTTMRAVISGTPVLVIPMHPLIDQPMVGAAIQKAGVGLTIAKKARPAEIREAVARLLGTPSYRLAATEAARRHLVSGGVPAAADALGNVLKARPATRAL